MNLRSFVSLDSRYPVAFPALVSFLIFAAVIGLALAFSGSVKAAPPSQFDLKAGLSGGGPNPRDLLTLSVYSRSAGTLAVYEGCKDFGHYWSNDRSQPVGYAYFSCSTYGYVSGFNEKWDVAPQTMSISMFIDGETREECAVANEGYHASYNNRFISLTCR